MAKAFDGAACIGDWVSKDKFLDTQRIRFRLDVNGVEAQQGFTGDMLHTVDEVISYVSQYCTLKTGDLLFSGTPAGVGPVNIDDHLEGYLEDRKVLDFHCR